jgi:hypothetical protein
MRAQYELMRAIAVPGFWIAGMIGARHNRALKRQRIPREDSEQHKPEVTHAGRVPSDSPKVPAVGSNGETNGDAQFYDIRGTCLEQRIPGSRSRSCRLPRPRPRFQAARFLLGDLQFKIADAIRWKSYSNTKFMREVGRCRSSPATEVERSARCCEPDTRTKGSLPPDSRPSSSLHTEVQFSRARRSPNRGASNDRDGGRV